jgi:hypothetical protein
MGNGGHLCRLFLLLPQQYTITLYVDFVGSPQRAETPCKVTFFLSHPGDKWKFFLENWLAVVSVMDGENI